MDLENWAEVVLVLLCLLSPSSLLAFVRDFISSGCFSHVGVKHLARCGPLFGLEALDTGAPQIIMLDRPFVLFLCTFPGKVTALMAAALTAEFSPLC